MEKFACQGDQRMTLCRCRLRSHLAGQEEATEEIEVLLAVVEDSGGGKDVDA